jgi:hypothetical protein
MAVHGTEQSQGTSRPQGKPQVSTAIPANILKQTVCLYTSKFMKPTEF